MKSEQVEGGVWVSQGRVWRRAGSLMLDSVSNKADTISRISPDKTIWRARESAAGAAALATLPSELLTQRQQSFRKQYLQSFIYVSISGVIFLFGLNQYFFEIKFDNN